MTAGALRVVAPGLMTTVQDLGRRGYQQLGVPVSGALDPVSLRIANLLVGNPGPTAVLEIAYQGPTLAVEADSVRVALAGGEAPVEVLPPEGDTGPARRLGVFESARLVRGQRLRVGAVSGSAMLYLAVEGGLAVPVVLASRSTLIRGAIGGFEGRPLRKGDALPLVLRDTPEREEMMLPPPGLAPPPRVRVVLGPQAEHFTEAGLATLLSASYTIAQASDRMGMRLEGPTLEHSPKGYNIVSDGTAPGSIQVPGNGLPIILLADRQTTGGYPKIATVISADLPALGRMRPGASVSFAAVGVEEAEAAARALAAELAAMPGRLVPARREPWLDEIRLRDANLVSGVVSACD